MLMSAMDMLIMFAEAGFEGGDSLWCANLSAGSHLDITSLVQPGHLLTPRLRDSKHLRVFTVPGWSLLLPYGKLT